MGVTTTVANIITIIPSSLPVLTGQLVQPVEPESIFFPIALDTIVTVDFSRKVTDQVCLAYESSSTNIY